MPLPAEMVPKTADQMEKLKMAMYIMDPESKKLMIHPKIQENRGSYDSESLKMFEELVKRPQF